MGASRSGRASAGARHGPRNDRPIGSRFDTLRKEFGDNFIAVEFPGVKHTTLTAHRQQEGIDRVLALFAEKLKV